jgi:hypothetical protein
MSLHQWRCECGAITGMQCEWSGALAETVILEWMPEWLRAGHIEAGNRGSYPRNGAQHLRVSRSCAEALAGEWATVVTDE